MELKIKALSPKIGTEIPLPKFATAGAACMDLCACIDQPVTLAAGARRLIPTGLAIALPSADYVALVFARSGLGIKQGVCLANGVGVIDSDYRGEIGVGLVNLGDDPYTAKQGRGISVPILGDRALIFNSIRTPFPKNMKTIRNILCKLYDWFTRRPGKTTRASCRPASSRRRPCTAAARRRTAPASPW